MGFKSYGFGVTILVQNIFQIQKISNFDVGIKSKKIRDIFLNQLLRNVDKY
jgi:hypothetical protein